MKTMNNPSLGRHWVMNRQLKKCKRVDSSYVLEDGWENGRCFFNPEVEAKKSDIFKKKLKKKEQRISKWRKMYAFFVQHNNDFELMARTFNWYHTRNSFMTACKRYLPEYVPLPNNRWK